MNKKKSPKSIPRSQQDVDRAYERGRCEGINGALVLFLYTMFDKFGADDKTLKEFADAFGYTLDSVEKGYVTYSDLKRVVKVEYGTVLEYK